MPSCSNSPGSDYWDFDIVSVKPWYDHSSALEEYDASGRFPYELKKWLDKHNFAYNGRYINIGSARNHYGEGMTRYKMGIRLYDAKAAMLYKLTWM